MATIVGNIKDQRIILAAAVSVPGVGGHRFRCNALMDTGAQVTMISKKVVSEVGVQPIGHMSIMPVTGTPSQIEKYRAKIDIRIESQAILPGGKVGRKDFFEDWIWKWEFCPMNPPNMMYCLE